ncbi:hypothetical protein ABS71_03675 [bacterium SCN 62-11]|nr:MAG: hypothetical protein ABS71_03675 [bacterium SCN 62-11]
MARTQKDRFDYQGEKLSQARSALMLPHSRGEEYSLADAFSFCDRAFTGFSLDRIKDPEALRHVMVIQRWMDTSGLSEDVSGEGTWVKRGRMMSVDNKLEFSRAVDELADWFNREFWSDD